MTGDPESTYHVRLGDSPSGSLIFAGLGGAVADKLGSSGSTIEVGSFGFRKRINGRVIVR